MATEKYLDILELGKEAWNIWYNARYRGPADLKGINLACADLAGINFSGALLETADLRYTNLSGADLRGADFSGAKLARAILRGANLRMAKGLTTEQLHYAEGDKKTLLPIGMKRPAHWCSTNEELSKVPRPGPVQEHSSAGAGGQSPVSGDGDRRNGAARVSLPESRPAVGAADPPVSST
jgi:hypothetical protein